jgi:hypothetical protein
MHGIDQTVEVGELAHKSTTLDNLNLTTILAIRNSLLWAQSCLIVHQETKSIKYLLTVLTPTL